METPMETDSNSLPIKEASQILKQALGERFELTKEQEIVIGHLCSQENTLYIDKTGAGKSASFFITTRLLRKKPEHGPVIVVCPLVALMNDQCQNAEKFNLKAKAFHSSLPELKKSDIIASIRKNTLDIVYITPEYLTSTFGDIFIQLSDEYDPKKETTKWQKIPLVVIDEVHCVSDWGHDFRPSYFTGMKALQKKKWFKNALKLATSATVNDRVQRDITDSLGGKWETVQGKLFRDNIHLRVVPQMTANAARKEWLLKFFKELKDEKNVLIFVMKKTETTEIASLLKEYGAVAYSADIPSDQREQIEKSFKSGKTRVLVSTNAIGMGFDKSDINYVIHTYTPPTPIQYYQEIGRIGRDGSEATAFLLPTAPWINGEPERVRTLICRYLRQDQKPQKIEEVKNMILSRNVKEADFATAVEILTKKGDIRNEKGQLILLDHKNSEVDDSDRVKLREQEKHAMEQYRKASKCLWDLLLTQFGESLPDGCKICSYCEPKGGVIVDPAVAEDYWYYTTTPKNKIPVFALGKNDDKIFLSGDKVKGILTQQGIQLDSDPASWCVTFIPQNKVDKNEQNAKDLAEALGLDLFKFVKPFPATLGMTSANNNSVREDILKQKFPEQAFSLPIPLCKGVIVLDDAMKSGQTLDRVGGVLQQQHGKAVVAIVTTVWEMKDGPKVETKKLV